MAREKRRAGSAESNMNMEKPSARTTQASVSPGRGCAQGFGECLANLCQDQEQVATASCSWILSRFLTATEWGTSWARRA